MSKIAIGGAALAGVSYAAYRAFEGEIAAFVVRSTGRLQASQAGLVAKTTKVQGMVAHYLEREAAGEDGESQQEDL